MFNVATKNVLSSTGIAILASLGIHGLLWAVLPGLTVSQADKSPSERTINLVELSPQEQSRLPQVYNPADDTLPAFASQLTALPPLPPAPPYQTSVIPPVQLPPGSAPVYNIPYQNSAPAPQTFQGSVPPPPPTNTSFQGTVPPPPPTNTAIPDNNSSNSPNSWDPFIPPANTDQPNTLLTPDPTLPETNQSVRQKLRDWQEQARQRNKLAANDQSQTNPRLNTNERLNRALRDRKRQEAVEDKYPDAVTKSPIRRKLTTCDRALDDLAIVSVVVNPQGKRLSEPVLITSPRKANLTEAQNYVRNYGFTKTGQTTNYNFRLEFDYIASKCTQAKPTPTPTPDSTPAPALSSPKPTPALDSTPTPTPTPALNSPKPTPLPLDPNKPSF